MVRLKAFLCGPFFIGVKNFNSSMVRLKVEKLSEDAKRMLNFNSSMVRLKGASPSQKRLLISLFQFLNGSIKRLASSFAMAVSSFISIPQWFD